jgi:hypothetical protein
MNEELITQMPLQGAGIEMDTESRKSSGPSHKRQRENRVPPQINTSARRDRSAGLNKGAGGVIRPLGENDVEDVARLHERIMPQAEYMSHDSLRENLSRVLLQNPWRDDTMPSLVYEENDGRVTGCLGVMPRPMTFKGQRFTAAVSHSYIVDPGSRSGLAALRLAKAFLAGPQDLSMAEGNDMSRRVWEMAGGSVTLLYSLCWTRPVKPGRYALWYLRRRGLPPMLKWALHLSCRLADVLAPMASRSFRFTAPAVTGATLDAQTFHESFSALTKKRVVRPEYDANAARWMLDTLAAKQGRGDFYHVSVANEQRETVGWYMYYGKSGETGAVVQISAKQGCAEQVVDHLFHHASRHGIIALSGQVDPTLFHVLGGKDCLFHHDGGSWFMLHSRRPEILQAIHSGDAFLSRLEGEWWIGFLLS